MYVGWYAQILENLADIIFKDSSIFDTVKGPTSGIDGNWCGLSRGKKITV